MHHFMHHVSLTWRLYCAIDHLAIFIKKRGINNKISAMLLLLIHQIDHTKVIGHMGELHGWTLMTWMKLKIENEIDHKGNKWMKLTIQLSHMIWHGFFWRCIFPCNLLRGWKQRISHKKFTYWWSWQYWWTSPTMGLFFSFQLCDI